MFFKLLKQHLFLYTVLTTNTLDTGLLGDVSFYQLAEHSYEIKNLKLSDGEIFPRVQAATIEGKAYCEFMVEDDRYLLRTKEYFGKDSYVRNDLIQKGPMAGMSKLKSKTLYFYDQIPSVSVWIKSSPVYGNSLTIRYIEPYQPFTFEQGADNDTLIQHFIAICVGQSDHVLIGTPGADMKPSFRLMDTYQELKNRNQLHLLKDLLSHEHDNVRRWAASCLLIVDEKLAL